MAKKRSRYSKNAIIDFYVLNGVKKTCKQFDITPNQMKCLLYAERIKNKKISSRFTDAYVKKIQGLAYKECLSRGSLNDAEDFAQFILEKLIRTKKDPESIHIKELYVDYIRELNPGSRSESGPIEFTYIEDEIKKEDKKISLKDQSQKNDLVYFVEIANQIGLKHDQRIAFILTHVYGMDDKEIGYVIGKETSSVDQLLKKSHGSARRLMRS